MNIIRAYEEAISQHHIVNDDVQRQVLERLQGVSDELHKHTSSWFRKRFQSWPKGIYLHGHVGVGKTFLMDLFFQHVACKKKARFHFHHFMQNIDQQLRELQGKKDPLKIIASRLSKTSRLICFDEFLVQDVATAMMLASLIQAFIHEGIVLVMTSNTPPDLLYLNGLQRKRFLPAIALIKQHCDIISLEKNKDYRLGRQVRIDAYLYPLNDKTQQRMEEEFQALAPVVESEGVIEVQNRSIPFLYRSEVAIWFDFSVICHTPRSQLDYLEITQRFKWVFVSHLPKLTEEHTRSVILFIHFIDVMYDRGMGLVLSSAVSLDALYLKGEMLKPFQRTLSRLHEMQSEDYVLRHL